MNQKKTRVRRAVIWTILVLLLLTAVNSVWAADLKDIKERGVIRHLGIPYANFVTGSGDGLDVELVKLFAQYLGVKYQYVESSWDSVIGDLTGKKVKSNGDDIKILGEVPVKGDIIASGFTILNWRKKIVDFSTPTFPNQVWLVARADSPLKPIVPHESVEKDIAAVRALLKGRSLLGKASTCLDPSLYDLKETGARIKMFPGSLNDLAPAVINGECEADPLGCSRRPGSPGKISRQDKDYRPHYRKAVHGLRLCQECPGIAGRLQPLSGTGQSGWNLFEISQALLSQGL